MNAQECLQILRDVKDVTFATTDENGRPRARIIDVMLVEEGRLYFCTARGKDFYRELTEGGYVAVNGMNRAFQMVRLEGKARKLGEQKRWIDRIFYYTSLHRMWEVQPKLPAEVHRPAGGTSGARRRQQCAGDSSL